VVEHPLGTGAEVSANAWVHALKLIKMPDDVGALLSGRQAFAVGCAGPDGGRGLSLPGLYKEKGAQPGRLWFRLAMETNNVTELAPAGDRYISQVVQSMEQGDGVKTQCAADFGGAACHAMRTLPLEIPERAKIGLPMGGRMTLAWSYPSDAGGDGNKPRPGWWLVSLTPERSEQAVVVTPAALARVPAPVLEPASTMQRLTECLVRPREGAGAEIKPWLSIGFCRPAEFAPLIGSLIPGGWGASRVLERIPSITWRFWVNPEHGVQGTFEVELRSPTAP
jgi:hypothetical protein